jgi:hypothetical protein
MDGQLGTRDGSPGRPGPLLEISFPTHNSSTPYLNIHTVFVTGEDEHSRYNYRRYYYFMRYESRKAEHHQKAEGKLERYQYFTRKCDRPQAVQFCLMHFGTCTSVKNSLAMKIRRDGTPWYPGKDEIWISSLKSSILKLKSNMYMRKTERMWMPTFNK